MNDDMDFYEASCFSKFLARATIFCSPFLGLSLLPSREITFFEKIIFQKTNGDILFSEKIVVFLIILSFQICIIFFHPYIKFLFTKTVYKKVFLIFVLNWIYFGIAANFMSTKIFITTFSIIFLSTFFNFLKDLLKLSNEKYI